MSGGRGSSTTSGGSRAANRPASSSNSSRRSRRAAASSNLAAAAVAAKQLRSRIGCECCRLCCGLCASRRLGLVCKLCAPLACCEACTAALQAVPPRHPSYPQPGFVSWLACCRCCACMALVGGLTKIGYKDGDGTASDGETDSFHCYMCADEAVYLASCLKVASWATELDALGMHVCLCTQLHSTLSVVCDCVCGPLQALCPATHYCIVAVSSSSWRPHAHNC